MIEIIAAVVAHVGNTTLPVQGIVILTELTSQWLLIKRELEERLPGHPTEAHSNSHSRFPGAIVNYGITKDVAPFFSTQISLLCILSSKYENDVVQLLKSRLRVSPYRLLHVIDTLPTGL